MFLKALKPEWPIHLEHLMSDCKNEFYLSNTFLKETNVWIIKVGACSTYQSYKSPATVAAALGWTKQQIGSSPCARSSWFAGGCHILLFLCSSQSWNICYDLWLDLACFLGALCVHTILVLYLRGGTYVFVSCVTVFVYLILQIYVEPTMCTVMIYITHGFFTIQLLRPSDPCHRYQTNIASFFIQCQSRLTLFTRCQRIWRF